MAFPSISTLLWSITFEPFAFLLCLGVHFLPAWIANRATTVLRAVGFDAAQCHNYQPHIHAPFEGYYTRITTKEGATILLIFSTVRNAKKEHKPHLLHFSYIPRENHGKTLVFNIHPERIVFKGNTGGRGTELELTAIDERGQTIGTQVVSKDGTIDYQLTLPVDNGSIEVDIQLRKGTVWGGKSSTAGPGQGPEGPLSALEYLLPLHWFVRSVSAEAEVNIEKVLRQPTGEEQVVFEWQEQGRGHIEKNWGASFPTGWVWIQSLVPEIDNGNEVLPQESPSYVALAGGCTVGLKAFFLGFDIPLISRESTEKSINWTFRPISTMLLPVPWFGGYVSPFCREEYDSKNGIFKIQVLDWTWKDGWRKVVLTCRGAAAINSKCDNSTTTCDYLELPCPMSTGHDNLFAKETFEASIFVEAYARKKSLPGYPLGNRSLGRWELIATQSFKKGALEWGGQYWGTKSVENMFKGVTWLDNLLDGKPEETS
ncbi:hypothetical protein EV426DRAFT_620794 [Tirmania nivea]|nr:hypothetical protein EV426DRAFT_620794 [Tirmania nivea]